MAVNPAESSFFAELQRRNVLRVAVAYAAFAWFLIQLVETLFPIFGFTDAQIRLAVLLLFIGFPLVLVFSWLYELTPEGLKLERDIDRSQSTTSHTGKRLDRAIIVVLTISVGYFAVDKFVLDPARDAEQREIATQKGRSEALTASYGDSSIAVMPFVNMSDDAGNEYFSDGISEELLNLLSRVPRLRVISRSSSFSLKGRDITIPEVAKLLNVALVLEGSVRKHGNKVRITAQLIEARSDTHLWSDTYDRTLEDVFAIQDEISAAIVDALSSQLNLNVGAAPTVTATASTEAHDAVLRGRYLVAQRTPDGLKEGIVEFEKALSLDPDYAPAHAQLAITAMIGTNAITELSAEQLDTISTHIERAVSLDPSLAEAYAAAGFLGYMRYSMEESLPNFRKAIQLNPSYSEVYTWMSLLVDHGQGRYAEAFAMRETAARLDPVSFSAINNHIELLIWKNRLTDARREMEKLASIYPRMYEGWLAVLAGIGGHWANMIETDLDAWRRRGGTLYPRERFWYAQAFARVGLAAESSAMLENPHPEVMKLQGNAEGALIAAQARVSDYPKDEEVRFHLGMALAGVGDYASARPILEEQWQRWNLVVRDGLFEAASAAALIAIRIDADEEETIGELIMAIKDNVRRYREAGIPGTSEFYDVDWEDGLAEFLSGNAEQGLELIARAVEAGFFIPPGEAYLQVLYDDPGFAPIRARQEARQAEQRERLLAVVCNDNPYAAVWQPAEETCAGYFATRAS